MQVATWWWLFISLNTYGGLAAPLTVIAVVGLAAFWALYYAAACALFVAIASVHWAGRAMLFAALWLLAELARVALFTGLPWGGGGYAQHDGPFADLAKIIGAHGLTFAAVLLGAGFASLTVKPRWLSAGMVAASMVLAASLSIALKIEGADASGFSKAVPAPFTVTLLQGNIAQDEKFQPAGGIPDALKWYQPRKRN